LAHELYVYVCVCVYVSVFTCEKEKENVNRKKLERITRRKKTNKRGMRLNMTKKSDMLMKKRVERDKY